MIPPIRLVPMTFPMPVKVCSMLSVKRPHGGVIRFGRRRVADAAERGGGDPAGGDLQMQPGGVPPIEVGVRHGEAVHLGVRRPRHAVDVVMAVALDMAEAEEAPERQIDRKSVVSGKSVSVRGDLGGRRSIKKKKNTK